MQVPRPGILRIDPDLRWKDQFVTYTEVERAGLFGVNNFYVFQHQWFQEKGFKHWQSEDNRFEDFYLQRVGGDGVKENIIWWRATKVVNEWITYLCKMDWQNYGSKPTEVMYNGKKVKTDKAGLTLRIWWWVQIDPHNRWEKSIIGNWSKWVYGYLLDTDMENHRDKCMGIAKEHENQIKQWFEMTTTAPMPRSYFPEMGYKWVKPKDEEAYLGHADHKGDKPLP